MSISINSTYLNRITTNWMEQKEHVLQKALVSAVSIIAISILAIQPMTAGIGIAISALSFLAAYTGILVIKTLNQPLRPIIPTPSFIQKVLEHVKAYRCIYSTALGVALFSTIWKDTAEFAADWLRPTPLPMICEYARKIRTLRIILAALKWSDEVHVLAGAAIGIAIGRLKK